MQSLILLFQISKDRFGLAFENFVFVGILTFEHSAPDLIGDKFNASSPDSSFKNTTAAECEDLLRRLAKYTDDCVLRTVFAIFDDRSAEDGSVILVQTVDVVYDR